MVRLIYFILLLICCTGYAQQIRNSDFKKLFWLEGFWAQTNTKAGHLAHERWVKINDKELFGFGVTIKGKDTLFLEKIKIISRPDGIFYVADVSENEQPVFFKLIKITNDGFTCENLGHDFPKKIVYLREGSKLKVTTSGDGKSVDFLFEKMEKQTIGKK